jgi:septal ring factor EnvC (AmiA/AmiB activator)
MAGIFANVDSDIQKLQKLKQEIENVKKSLKSINVKVDIDIAQGLEAQLKSLTTQYDALAAKVGETEARITASANKIIDASNKIIQAQDKMSQAAKGINTSSSTNTNSSTNASETTSIQAQAKAYEELKAEIGDVLGTRGQNIKRLIEEQNAVRLLNAEIKKITKSQGESSSLSSAQQRRLEQLNNSLLTHKTALAEVRQSLSANAKLDNAAATSMDALSQSLGRMRAAYRALTESERTSPFGKELLVSIQQADAKIKELDATIGNHQRNVGNYASGWNGLSMSIQQIGRELPSLAAGWRTFFLAISNNLPILADEIKRARIQFEALKKSGQTAIPVWKQVVSSIVSWQTALTVGITLLTLYGDKLVKWISGLGKAEKAIKNLYTAQRDLYNVTSTGMEQSSKEITKLNSLYKIATDVTKSTKERNNAVKELKRSFPSHLKNLSDESIKNGEVAKSIKEQTRQIIANAKATAAADQIAKNWYKSFQAGVSKNIAYITKQRLEQELVAKEATVQQLSQMRARPESYAGLAKEIEGIKDRIKETDREIAIQENLQDSYQKSSQSLEKLVTVAGLGGKYENPDKNYNSILDQQKKIANLLDKQALERKRREEDLENQVVQSRIDAMAEGEAKIRAQRELDNKKEIQDLKRQREDYIRTEIEYQRKLFDAREELNVKKNKNYKKKTFDPSSVKVDTSSIDATIGYVSKRQINDQIRNQEEAWNEYIIKYGTFQQKKEAITRKYADAINKAANAGEAASLQKEFEEALANLDLSKLKEEINWEMIFGDLSKVTKDQLTKIKKQLQEFKKSSEFKNATPEQIQVIETAINSINDTLVDKGGFFGGMADSMKELADATEQLKKAEEELVEADKKGTDAEKEEAQKKVNKAQNTQVNAQTNVEKSRDKAISNITAVADAMQQLGSAEFNLSSFGSAVGGLVDALSESGSKIGGIIAAVLSLLDEFGKDGGVEFGKNIVNNVISAIGGTIEVPFKMLGIDLGLGGANYSDYNEMVAKYDVLLDVWDQLLDKKKAYINESYGAEATKAGKEALDLLKAERDITRELASERLDAGASAGSHSMAYRMWQGSYKYEGQNWKDVAGEISSALGGVEFSNMWNLLYMSADQLEWIKTNYSGLWSQMDTDFRGYLDDIIQYGETEAEIIESVKEQITGISFDSFRDSYVSLLSDLDSTNKDFADSFEEYLRKSILQSVISKNYDTKIQELYDSWSKAGEDGLFSESEVDRLRSMQQSITDAMLAERDRLEEVFGWSSSSSQEASKKGFATASQDSIDELNGRFTALQIAGEEIKNQNQLQTMSILELRADMLPIIANTTGIKDIASETRDLLRLSYEELTGIHDDTTSMNKSLKNIETDIAEVKRNTSKL